MIQIITNKWRLQKTVQVASSAESNSNNSIAEEGKIYANDENCHKNWNVSKIKINKL